LDEVSLYALSTAPTHAPTAHASTRRSWRHVVERSEPRFVISGAEHHGIDHYGADRRPFVAAALVEAGTTIVRMAEFKDLEQGLPDRASWIQSARPSAIAIRGNIENKSSAASDPRALTIIVGIDRLGRE
jgi:hypothetical protein